MNATALFPRILSPAPALSAAEHDLWLEQDRASYAALLSLGPELLSPADAATIITRLLAVTRDTRGQPVPLDTKRREDAAIAALLPRLPAPAVVGAFSTLVERRVNNQRTSGCILSYVFGAPELERWAVTYRPRLRRLVAHALGRNTVSSLLRALEKPASERAAHETALVERNLLRHARDRTLAAEVFQHLFGRLREPHPPMLRAYLEARADLTAGRGLPFKTLQGLAGTFHPKTRRRTLHELAPSEKLKRDVEAELLTGDTSAVGLLRRWYGGEKTALAPFVDALTAEAERLPRWDAHVVVVADASASMRGIGHRSFNAIAIAAVVARLVEMRAAKHALIVAGGAVQGPELPFPLPAGATALAPAIVQAAQRQPDAIVVVSDGYENVEQGDAARVAEALERLRFPARIVQVLPSFTVRENLAGRRLAATWPLVQETGLAGFEGLWFRLRAHAAPEQALRELTARASCAEGEKP